MAIEIPDGWRRGRCVKIPPTADLEEEVYLGRANDLVGKLEEVVHQAGYEPDVVFVALSNLLVTRFTEASAPDTVFRMFIQMLAQELDEASEPEEL